eukprot:4083311-Ditylum_brightwellii.AAC.1
MMTAKQDLNKRQDVTARTPSWDHNTNSFIKVIKRRSIANTMYFVIMTQKNATMGAIEGSTCIPLSTL